MFGGFLVVVLDFSPLVILHLQYHFIFLCGSGLQCFLPSLPSSIQSLLDHGKADGRPYVLFHLHYITSCCIAAQVLYLLSYLFLYAEALNAYDWESRNIFHSPFFVLPTANSVSFSSWLFEVRLSNLCCAPDHRSRPQLLAKDHRNGIIVFCWSNLLAMQRFATLWGFLWCFWIQSTLT